MTRKSQEFCGFFSLPSRDQVWNKCVRSFSLFGCRFFLEFKLTTILICSLLKMASCPSSIGTFLLSTHVQPCTAKRRHHSNMRADNTIHYWAWESTDVQGRTASNHSSFFIQRTRTSKGSRKRLSNRRCNTAFFRRIFACLWTFWCQQYNSKSTAKKHGKCQLQYSIPFFFVALEGESLNGLLPLFAWRIPCRERWLRSLCTPEFRSECQYVQRLFFREDFLFPGSM